MATFEDLLRETIRAEIKEQIESLTARISFLEGEVSNLNQRLGPVEAKQSLIYAYETLEQALEAKTADMPIADKVAFFRSITEQVG